jgi:hypothetical protein
MGGRNRESANGADGWLPAEERAAFSGLDSPPAIQAFVDDLAYSSDPIYRCPRSVLRDRRAHCYDGAVLAAAALRRIGHRPRIVELLPDPIDPRDDDHLLAVFQHDGLWGAVGKSNFVGLRYREPIHRTLRELVLTYFEAYYNLDREKTLRGYTRPLDLSRFDRIDWVVRDAALDTIAEALERSRKAWLLTPATVATLSLLDRRSFEAGLLGADEAGLHRPPRRPE